MTFLLTFLSDVKNQSGYYKKTAFFILVLSCSLPLFAQTKLDFSGDSLVYHNGRIRVYPLDSLKTENILSGRAFLKMSKNYYSYAIAGTNTPVSGIKITTAAPSVTISGNLAVSKNKSFILNAQLAGGSDNNISQIFSGKKLNGYFSATIGTNFFIHALMKGIYTKDNFAINTARNRYKKSVIANLYKQIDSAVVINQLHKVLLSAIDSKTQQPLSIDVLTVICIDTINALYTTVDASPTARYINIGFRAVPNEIEPAEARTLIVNMLRRYLDDQATEESKLLQTFQDKYLVDPIDAFDNDFAKLSYLGLQEPMHDYVDTTAIKTFGPLFQKVRFFWINFSPSITNNSLTFYDPATQIIADTLSLLYGASLSLNMLKKSIGSYQFFYEQIGFSVTRTNNIADLTKLNYQTNSPLPTTAGTSQETKSGTAYSGALAQGWGWSQFYEMYCIFSKSQFFPGLYFRYDLSYQSTAINQHKLAPKLGLIWNLNSSDATASGSKNIISLVPYVTYSNILNNNFEDAAHTKPSSRSDLFSVGINLSLPININNN